MGLENGQQTSGLWCPEHPKLRAYNTTKVAGGRQYRLFPIRGHWVYRWTVHDEDAPNPNQPIAIATIKGIELDDASFGDLLDAIEAGGLDQAFGGEIRLREVARESYQ